MFEFYLLSSNHFNEGSGFHSRSSCPKNFPQAWSSREVNYSCDRNSQLQEITRLPYCLYSSVVNIVLTTANQQSQIPSPAFLPSIQRSQMRWKHAARTMKDPTAKQGTNKNLRTWRKCNEKEIAFKKNCMVLRVKKIETYLAVYINTYTNEYSFHV